jgi:hypothetical protein
VSFRFRLVPASSPCTTANCNGSPAANHGVGSAAVEPLDGDEVLPERARERRPAGAECGWAARGVDCSTGDGSGAQPAVRLYRQLHPTPRARLRRAGEPLHVRTVLPLRGGFAQLRPQRDFTGSHLHRRLRGIPGDPSELGSLGPPLPRGAASHARSTGAPRGMHRRLVDLAAGLGQGVLHPLHDDLQQRGMGEGVVLPPQ